MRIASILNEKEITLSCEVFPPKHFDGIAQASAVAQEIAGLHPSFMSVTYGAAGSTPGHTIAVAKAVAETGVTPLCHLTCVQSTREHVQHVLADMKTAGMENVLALRGDLPKEGEPCHDFAYAAELIDFIHQQGDFCVGAACYPEGHPEADDKTADIANIKKKVDAGCEFLTTQMFFDNSIFYNYLYRLREAGIFVPVIAGIMPITKKAQLARSIQLSGCCVPAKFRSIVDWFGDESQKMQQAGIAYATEQIIDLFANGIKNVHVYTMNNPEVALGIQNNLSEIIGK